MSVVFEAVAFTDPPTMVQRSARGLGLHRQILSTTVSKPTYSHERAPADIRQQWIKTVASINVLVTYAHASKDGNRIQRLSSAIANFMTFSRALSNAPAPRLWADESGELCAEWLQEERRAIATFSGDGELGYALLRHGEFVPGDDAPVDSPGRDLAATALLNYLGSP